MDFLHDRKYLDDGDVVIVNCNHQCNVLVMSDQDLHNYRSSDNYYYYGGHYRQLPARIRVPSTGWWNTVLDLGGGEATIRHSIRYITKRT